MIYGIHCFITKFKTKIGVIIQSPFKFVIFNLHPYGSQTANQVIHPLIFILKTRPLQIFIKLSYPTIFSIVQFNLLQRRKKSTKYIFKAPYFY